MASYIQTNDGISVFIDGAMRSVSRDTLAYPKVVAAIQRGASQDEIKGFLTADREGLSQAIEALKDQQITDDVAIAAGAVLYKGSLIDDTLTARMLRQLKEGFDLKPMARFLENLQQNPSYRAVSDLYSFLEYGKMPITEDGCFLAYRAVRADYRDIRTGTIDNSIGQEPVMRRNQVDENPDRVCSRGFHACSFEYLPFYSHVDGHVMIVKINPRDVVAIPKDYNQTKMRVSRYRVVGELEGYYSERRNRLAESEISMARPPFEVRTTGLDGERCQSFETLTEAARAADEALKDDEVESVEVRNITTDTEIDLRRNPNFVGEEDDPEDDPKIALAKPEPTAPAVPVGSDTFAIVARYRVHLGGDALEDICGSFEKLDAAMKYATLLYADHPGESIFVKDHGKAIAVLGGVKHGTHEP